MLSEDKMKNIANVIACLSPGTQTNSQVLIINDKRVLLKDTDNLGDKRFVFSSVFTVNRTEVNDYDAYIFCVKSALPEFFIFTRKQLISYIDLYKRDRRVVGFYMGRTTNGSLLDYKDNQMIDLSKFYNNWNVLGV